MKNLEVLSLSELRFTAPDCLITKEGCCLTVAKKTLKNLMNSLGLVGDKFSKDLYDIDEAVWAGLVQRRCEASRYYAENSAIIANGEVINVVSDSNRGWLVKLEGIVKERTRQEGLDVQTLREEDGFSVLCAQEGGLGYVISADIPDKHIIAQNVYISPGGVFCILPGSAVDCKIDSGVNCSDLLPLLDHDALSGANCPDDYARYLKYIADADMSYSDCLDALRAVYGIQVRATVPAPSDYLGKIDASGYTEAELAFANRVLCAVYSKAYHYIPAASHLERHLRFVPIRYGEFIMALSSRYLSGNLDYKIIAKFSALAAAGSLDCSVVRRVFGRAEA